MEVEEGIMEVEKDIIILTGSLENCMLYKTLSIYRQARALSWTLKVRRHAATCSPKTLESSRSAEVFWSSHQ